MGCQKKRKLKEYLIEEIEKTGYPLEIEISSKLEEDAWFVINQDYFHDEQQNEDRTIDVSADKLETFVDGGYEPFSLSTKIVIECKKSSSHAWVFFTIPEPNLMPYYFDGQIFDFLTPFGVSVVRELFPSGPPRGSSKMKFLHYDNFERIAVTSHEIKLEKEKAKKNPKSEIFEARNQLVKYLSYNTGLMTEHAPAMPKLPSRAVLSFFFPVIVFDGMLYECEVKKGGPRLTERNHILLGIHYRPEYLISPMSYGIDVVKREYFERFLKDVNADIKLIEKQLAGKKEQIKKNVEKFISNYGPSARVLFGNAD